MELREEIRKAAREMKKVYKHEYKEMRYKRGKGGQSKGKDVRAKGRIRMNCMRGECAEKMESTLGEHTVCARSSL